MTKSQPETIDHFHITVDVAKSEVGDTLAQLQRLGYKIAGCELISDVLTFKQRNRSDSKAWSPSHEEFIADWLKERPAFQLSELRTHFRDHGRPASSSDYGVKVLVASGKLIALGDGRYHRADALLAAPEQSAVAHVDRRSRYKIDNRMLMWGVIGKRQTFLAAELREKFKQEERPTSSMYSQLSKMVDEGFFKQVEEGKYQVLKRPEKKHLNGKSNGVAAHA